MSETAKPEAVHGLSLAARVRRGGGDGAPPGPRLETRRCEVPAPPCSVRLVGRLHGCAPTEAPTLAPSHSVDQQAGRVI